MMEDMQKCKDNFAAVPSQCKLLDEEYTSKMDKWQKDKERFAEMKKQIEALQSADAVWNQEFSSECKSILAEISAISPEQSIQEKTTTPLNHGWGDGKGNGGESRREKGDKAVATTTETASVGTSITFTESQLPNMRQSDGGGHKMRLANKHLSALESQGKETDGQQARKTVHQCVGHGNKKEDMGQESKWQLVQVRQEKEAMTQRHQEELRVFQKRVTELEAIVATKEQELKLTTAHLDQQKAAFETQAKNHSQMLKLKEDHNAQLKTLTEKQKNMIDLMERKMTELENEVIAEKEANLLSATSTMNNQVDELAEQLNKKKQENKYLAKVLLKMRREMVSLAEQKCIASMQTEENINVQMLVDKHTKDLKAKIQELSKELEAAQKSTNEARASENSLKAEVAGWQQEFQQSQKFQKQLQAEKDCQVNEIQMLQIQIKSLNSKLQCCPEKEKNQPPVFKRKIIWMKPNKDQVKSTEGIVGWEEKKEYQAKLEKMANLLQEKDMQNISLCSQLATLKDVIARLENEKTSRKDPDLQKETLKLAAENLELKLQLEQINIDVPRLQDEVRFLRQMCTALNVDKKAAERQLAKVQQAQKPRVNMRTSKVTNITNINTVVFSQRR